MKTLLVLAHPEPKSFSPALFHQAAITLEGEGHKVVSSNLCRGIVF